MSWKPEVEVSRKGESNALLFETREEAQAMVGWAHILKQQHQEELTL